MLKPAAALLLLLGLAGCGGGGGGGGGATPPPPSAGTSGVVVGSYFRNARVCIDANANAACDAEEPAAFTDGSGRFTIAGAAGGAVVADIGIPATRYEPATGAVTPVASPIVLRAPAQSNAVVSVHSTAVVSEMETEGLAYDAALQKVADALGVSSSKVLGDFNLEIDARARAKLQAASNEGLKRIELALAHARPGEDRRRLIANATGTLQRVKTVVVIYLENRSFDHLYGLFPGANGIANALASPAPQVDRDGISVLPTLPRVWSTAASEWSYVASLPNAPFRIDAPQGAAGQPITGTIPDLVHRFYESQMQINGGANNQFAAWSNGGGLAMGYYDGSPMQLWKLAQQYTLADNFFQSAFGGSFLNHFWLVCACTPVWPDPPAVLASSVTGTRLDLESGSPASALAGPPVFHSSASLTPRMPDGNYYAVNTVQPPYQPSGSPPLPSDPRLANPTGGGAIGAIPLPPQTLRTIGDALTERGVDWKWYAGGWRQALADRGAIYNGTSPNYQPHHHPFNYFARFDPATAAGAAERQAHLRDYSDLVGDIAQGSLPPVAFYKPQGDLTQHPGYANVMTGDAHVAQLVAALQASPQWKDMVVVITYDENGGLWDHVAPPHGDAWGPGTRIPAIVISPYAKRGYIDGVPYDTTSILKLVTRRFDLDRLPGLRENVGDLSNALDVKP